MESKELLEQSLTKVLTWIEAAEGFVADHAPQLAQEIIGYGSYYHGGLAVFGVVLAIIAAVVFVSVLRAEKKISDDALGFCVVVSLIGFVIGLGMGTYNGFRLFFVLMAPRAYLIEQIRYLGG